MQKFRFKKEYEDAEIHIPGKRLVINKYNINDEDVRMVLKKYPRFSHNFEEVEEEGDVTYLKGQEVLEQGDPAEESYQDSLAGTSTADTSDPGEISTQQPTAKAKSSSKASGKGKKK